VGRIRSVVAGIGDKVSVRPNLEFDHVVGPETAYRRRREGGIAGRGDADAVKSCGATARLSVMVKLFSQRRK